MDFSEYVDRIWSGEVSIEAVHTGSAGEAEHMASLRADGWSEVADGVAFWPARSNVAALSTDEGVVLVDTGERPVADEMWWALRDRFKAPIRCVIYSHGHPDHTGGALRIDELEASQMSSTPRYVAHRAVLARFDKYRRSAGYNAIVNQRQFKDPSITWPTVFRPPDDVYDERHSVVVGNTELELHHGRGETDDQTWTFVPSRRLLCCGDFFMWVAPNAGNPQKSQRYAYDWALALREMAGCGAEILLPGHGYPIFGKDRIATALCDVSDYLMRLHDETLAMMNAGHSLDRIIRSLRPPEELLAKPYLRPLFDEPEFVVRNVWRYYGGWYAGDPAALKPAPEQQLAAELVSLAGGAARVVERAASLAAGGHLRLACHLARLAFLAAPQDEAAAATRKQIFLQRAAQERALMARSIFEWAADEPVGDLDP